MPNGNIEAKPNADAGSNDYFEERKRTFENPSSYYIHIYLEMYKTIILDLLNLFLLAEPISNRDDVSDAMESIQSQLAIVMLLGSIVDISVSISYSRQTGITCNDSSRED